MENFKMPKSRGRKPKNEVNNPPIKSVGLFDHLKHIQYVRDPKYYENLSEEGKKSFNLFLILRGLSMNPSFVEYAAYLYKFLDIIPPAQFYKVILELYPRHTYKEFHRWIKSRKENDDDVKKEAKLTELLVEKYEISKKEAKSYLKVFMSDKTGEESLLELVKGFGIDDKEAKGMI